jgi:chromosomal replication initiation ATPase DnaA
MYQLADPINREMISKIQQKLTRESRRNIVWETHLQSHVRFINDVIDTVKEKANDFLGLEFPPLFQERSRKREVVVMRQVAMFIIRKHAPYITLDVIAKSIGGRNHATVIHSVRQVENLIELKDYQYFDFANACIEEVSDKWEVKFNSSNLKSTLKNYL